MDANHVAILDTTLRDGEQSPGCSMTPSEKLRLARQLERLGVDVLEAGFPASSPAEWEAVHVIASEVQECGVAGLSRARESDIEPTARLMNSSFCFRAMTECYRVRWSLYSTGVSAHSFFPVARGNITSQSVSQA